MDWPNKTWNNDFTRHLRSDGPSLMWTPHEEARAKALARRAAELSAEDRAKAVTSFVPYYGVNDFTYDPAKLAKIKKNSKL